MRDLLRYRDLVTTLVARDLKVRYRRSTIGFVWTMLQPLLMMAVFHVVFSSIFAVKLPGGQEGVPSKGLLRRRGERIERSFAHCYETGGMRRTHLRGHENILKRLVVHVAGFNLGLLMRHLTGLGKPRVLQGAAAGLLVFVFALLALLWALSRRRK